MMYMAWLHALVYGVDQEFELSDAAKKESLAEANILAEKEEAAEIQRVLTAAETRAYQEYLAKNAAVSERYEAEKRNIFLLEKIQAKTVYIDEQDAIAAQHSREFVEAEKKLLELQNSGASEDDIKAQQATVAVANQVSLLSEDIVAKQQALLDDLVKEKAANDAAAGGHIAREEAARAAAAAADARLAEAKADAAKTQLASTFSGKLEGAAGRKRLLAQQQCFLLYNNHFFVYHHKNLLDGSARVYFDDTITPENKPIHNPVHGRQLSPAKVMTSPGYYSYVTDSTKIMLVEDHDQTNDSSILNRIKSKKKQEEFDKITPAEYAQLLPTIRLFKINYDQGKSSQRAIEFKFNNKINVTDLGAVGKTFEGSIRGDGAGVKSFEWSYLGSDSFTATRDLKATLKLNFQSFNELKKDRESDVRGTDGRKLKYKYLDLIIQPHCGEEDASSDKKPIYDPGCYEILAEVGYAVPTANSTLSPDMMEAVRTSIERLYLVMTDHAFEFEQDGTFSLTVNYRARLGSQMDSRKFNVLLPFGGNDAEGAPKNIKELKEKIAVLRKEEQEIGEDEAPEEPGMIDAMSDTIFGADKTPVEEAQEELDKYLEEQRMKFYNIVYSSLRNRRWIQGVQIPIKDEWKYLNYDQKIKDPKTGMATDHFVGLPDPLPSDHDLWHFWPDKTWHNMMDTSQSAEEQAKEKTEGRMKRLIEHYNSAASEPVRFVYFGDILAVVLDWIMGEERFGHTNYKNAGKMVELGAWISGVARGDETVAGNLEKLRISGTGLSLDQQVQRIRETFHIILGNVMITDFESKKARLVNLAHIPISLDSFLDFMTKKVVAKKREVYLFSSFVNDLLTDLVMRPLSTKCFGGLVPGSVRTQVSMLEIPSESEKEPISENSKLWFSAKSDQGAYAGEFCHFHPEQIGLPTGSNAVFLNTVPPVGKSGTEKKSFDYLLINSMSTKPKLYGVWDKGDFEEKHGTDPPLRDDIDDKTRGIPHYTFGQNTGILKTAKFQKTDQEFLPEAKYEQEGSNAINQLAAVYDVTFEMLGTARFQPGQYVYFDPITMGVGHPWQNETSTSDRSYANLMGLGGYHLVIEVSSNIQRGEFVTTLKTRWTTSGCHPTKGCPR